MYYSIQQYKVLIYIFPALLLLIQFRIEQQRVQREIEELENRDPIYWDQYQTKIWLQKCKESDLYLLDTDYYQPAETRQYRKKRGKEGKEERD